MQPKLSSLNSAEIVCFFSLKMSLGESIYFLLTNIVIQIRLTYNFLTNSSVISFLSLRIHRSKNRRENRLIIFHSTPVIQILKHKKQIKFTRKERPKVKNRFNQILSACKTKIMKIQFKFRYVFCWFLFSNIDRIGTTKDAVPWCI